MDTQWFLSLAGFALVALITPGPNNLMVMSSGLNFGYKKSLPHALGVVLGFSFMVFMVGLVLGEIFASIHWLKSVLQVFCVVYLVYLSYRIATSTGPSNDSNKSGKPMSFIEASIFQWINPKAWTMTLSAAGIYATTGELKMVLSMTGVFLLIGIPSIFSWMFLGKKMQVLLKDQRHLRNFNYTMAILLIVSVASGSLLS